MDKNYIIDNGKAYIVKDQDAYLITFGLDNKEHVKEGEQPIPVENQPRYSYDEIYRKLNIRQRIAEEKARQAKVAELKQFTGEIGKENDELKKQIENLKAENATLQAELAKLKSADKTQTEKQLENKNK